VFDSVAARPTLTAAALRRWLPALARRAPDLLSAYLVPGRVSPRLREAVMLGVTSVNRCVACDRVHRRWARATGLAIDDVTALAPDEAAAYRYGQALALSGPDGVGPPTSLPARHRRELEAASVLMELANLAGNRWLSRGSRHVPFGARLYDLVMRGADRAGLRRARRRIASGARGDVLEVGIGTGLNLALYPRGVSLRGIDPDEGALALAERRAQGLRRQVVLTPADAAALPFPDASFDMVVGTFVLCSVGDPRGTLAEIRRVLRSGGQVRFAEHARSEHRPVARAQQLLAPAWARVAQGCRLDQDVTALVRASGFEVSERRARGGGVLVELIASPSQDEDARP